MSRKVSIDNMADEIMQELDDYMETTDEVVDQAVKTVSGLFLRNFMMPHSFGVR